PEHVLLQFWIFLQIIDSCHVRGKDGQQAEGEQFQEVPEGQAIHYSVIYGVSADYCRVQDERYRKRNKYVSCYKCGPGIHSGRPRGLPHCSTPGAGSFENILVQMFFFLSEDGVRAARLPLPASSTLFRRVSISLERPFSRSS